MKRITTLTLTILISTLGFGQCLQAYYPFSGDAQDASGNGHHGTLHGATLTNDKDANANSAYLIQGNTGIDGSDIWIEIPNIVDGWQNLSMSIWVRHDSYATSNYEEAYVSYGTLPNMGWGPTGIHHHPVNLDIWYLISNNNDNRFSCNIDYQPAWDSTFQHYAMTYDGTTGTIVGYRNGVQVCTVTDVPGNIDAVGSYAGINKHSWANGAGTSTRVNGVFDELKVYDCVLDSTEILDLYISTKDMLNTKNDFKVFPNPSSGIFTVQNATGEIQVHDVFGRLVLTTNKPQTMPTGRQVDLSAYASGIYFVKVGEAVRKLVKQ